MHPTDTNADPPPSSRRVVFLLTAALWIVFACGLPLQTAHEARRQAHLQLAQVFTDGKPDAASVVAAFDRSTQDVIAASTLPCLVLAVSIIFLLHQMLKLKRRYNALERDLRTCQSHASALTDDPLD